MSYIKVLRNLVDQQQFVSVKANVQSYLAGTDDVQALPLKALAHAQLGERALARTVLAQAEAQRALFDLDARVDLAAVYCVMSRIDDAEDLLEPVVSKHPDHSLALARLAWCKMQRGEPDAARSLYYRSAELEPDRLPVWSALVGLCLIAGDIPAAQDALDKAINRLEAVHTKLPEVVTDQFVAQFRKLQLEIWIAADALAQAEQWLDERRSDLGEEEWVTLVVGYVTLLASRDRHAEAEDFLRGAGKHYPDNLNLISQIAELAQLQGRTMQAIQLLRRLIALAKKQDKPEVGFWMRLSGACLHQFTEQARKAAEKAVELAEAMTETEITPGRMIAGFKLQAKNAFAQVESQEQNFEISESLFNEVLEQNPYFLPALQGLAHQQMQCGKIDEAIALFERIKEIDPARGYSSLINARQFPEDEATLERMERGARQPSMAGQVSSGMLLQLASAWEKRKDFDKAFSLAVEANDASKKLLRYDPQDHRQRCARIRQAFSKELYEHRSKCGVPSTLPVYVLGMPRSGTTLVEQIIASHSQVFGAGELGVIPARIQGLNRWERNTGSARNFPDCVDDLTPYVVEGIANGILTELQELAANDKPNAKHIVDKLPHNFENIGLIKFFFPQAKIISVRRDPRDIAISNYFTDYQAKHGGMGFAYDLTWTGEQLADHNLLMHHWHQLFPGEILEVEYEDILEDTEGMARKMLDYIGVDWEPQVLAFNELDRPVKTASVWQVRQPIYKTSKAKWKRYEKHLTPLIKGTNAKIVWEPISDMLTLPEPGFLQNGVEMYRQGNLDGAEMSFKKMLHHNPDHAACNYMVGLVYCSKGHVGDGIPLMEKALEKCPWQREWRQNLEKAYGVVGEKEKLAELKQRYPEKRDHAELQEDENFADFDLVAEQTS